MKKQIKFLPMIFLALMLVFLSACSLKKNTPATTNDLSSLNGATDITANMATDTIHTWPNITLHAVATDCWTVIDGNVYDLTSYIASGKHKPEIVNGCGIDSTTLFNDVNKHNTAQAKNMLVGMLIGTVAN